MISAIRRRLHQSKYLQDILWQGSGTGVAQILSIFAMPILTRMYVPADFGVLNLFLQVVLILTIFLTWRYEYLIVLPRKEAHAEALFRFLMIVGVTTTALVTPLLYFQSDRAATWLGNNSLAPWLILAPVTGLLASITIALQQIIQRRQDYRNSALSEVINKIGYIGTGLLGWLWLPSSGGLLFATIVGLIGKTWWLLRSNKESPAFSGKSEVLVKRTAALPTALRYSRLSGSWVISHIFLTVTGGLPIFLITKMYGVEMLGQFSLVVATLYMPSTLIGNAIGQVYYQRAAHCQAHGESFYKLWRSTAKNLTLIGLPMYAVIALVAPWAYPFIFGDMWQPAGKLAVVLAVAAAACFISSPMDRTSLVVDAWWYSPLWNGVRAATTCLVAWKSWIADWPFDTFLLCLSAQTGIMFLIDWWAGWRFASGTRRDGSQAQ